MKRKPNPFEERQRLLDKARDAFVRAAAALTGPTRHEQDAVALAILDGAYGFMKAMEADMLGRGESTERVQEYLRAVQKEAA